MEVELILKLEFIIISYNKTHYKNKKVLNLFSKMHKNMLNYNNGGLWQKR